MDDVAHHPNLLTQLTCTPSRRSTKFAAGPNARQFFFFDSSVSRTARQSLFSAIFIFSSELIDHTEGRGVLANVYKPSVYTPEELVEVRVVCDPLHPAFGQAGLYAKKTIPGNTIVCPYAGYVEIFTTSCNSRTYTMGFGSSSDDYALDAEFAGNFGRFANDPRGIDGLSANISAENRMNARGEFFTALVSRRQILEGEELLMAYGKSHSLSASPWTDVHGRPLMRVRRGGELPFPYLEAAPTASSSQPSSQSLSCMAPDINSTAAAAGSAAKSRATPAFGLYWECPQCGGWNEAEPTPLSLARCAVCDSPKLNGCALVAALSQPPVRGPDLVRAMRCCGRVSQGAAGAATTAPHATFHGRPFPPSQITNGSSPSPESGNSDSATPASPLALSHDHSPASPSAHHSHHQQHHLHSVSYASIKVDWPMNVPFIPWQVWDPSVPLTTLMKLSKFETHEHIFLFHVTYGVEGEDDGDDAGDADEQETHSPTRTDHDDEDGAADNSAASGAWEVSASRSHKRARTASASAVSDQHPASDDAPRTNRARRVSTAQRMAKTVAMRDEHPLVISLVTSSGPAHADSVHASDDALKKRDDTAVASRALLPFLPSAGALALGQLLRRPREVERLIHLPSWSMVMAAVGHSGVGQRRPLSPLLHARDALRGMSQRVLSAKAFDAGDVVATFGGAVRPLCDVRCRPDWSPLCIPLRYVLPTAWRQTVLRDGDAPTDQHPSVTADDSTQDATADTAAQARRKFLSRLATLCLVVTNEMMYCPCVIAPLDEDERDTVTVNTHGVYQRVHAVHAAATAPTGGGGGNNGGDAEDCDGEKRTYEEERKAVLAECNVALVLTMDPLGSPFVAAIATQRIEAFEPLLARMQ